MVVAYKPFGVEVEPTPLVSVEQSENLADVSFLVIMVPYKNSANAHLHPLFMVCLCHTKSSCSTGILHDWVCHGDTGGYVRGVYARSISSPRDVEQSENVSFPVIIVP